MPISMGVGASRNPGGEGVGEMEQGRHPVQVAPGVKEETGGHIEGCGARRRHLELAEVTEQGLDI